MKHLGIVVISALALLVMGCSSAGTLDMAASEAPAAAVSGQVADALPAIPGERSVAGLTPSEIQGSWFAFKNENANIQNESIIYAANDGEFAWSIYQFGIEPENAHLHHVTFDSIMAPGNEAWIAVANFDTHTWEIHGPFTGEFGDVELSNNTHVSPDGQIFIAGMTYDANFATLHSTQLVFDGMAAAE